MSTAERIKTRRLARKLTQDKMETLTGIDQGYLSLIENGRRKRISGDLLMRIAKALGCTIEDLIGPRPLATAA